MPIDSDLLNSGRRLHQAGQFSQAQEIYRQALATDPHNVDVLNLLGAVCINLRQWSEAAEYLAEALRLNPRYPAAHDNWGVLLTSQNRWVEAIECFRRALALSPQAVQTQLNLAKSLSRNGQIAEAIEAFRRVVQLAPDTVSAHEELARELSQQNRLPEALLHFRHLARLRPDDARAHFDLAVRLALCGAPGEAINAYWRTLELKPESAEACVNLANLLAERNELDQAVELFHRALRYRPHFAEAYVNLGSAYTRQRKLTEAIETLREAARLKPQMPESYNNLGIALGEQGRFAEAAEQYRQSLAIRPENADAIYNLSGIAACSKQGDIPGAIHYFDHALRLKPDYAEAHHNRSAAHLLTGHLVEGFAEYEWRFRSRDFTPQPFRWPQWDGSDLAGRTIVLCAEQGLGDTLEFVRYASEVQKRGARVIVECQGVLHSVLARTPGVDGWITQTTNPAPPADCCTRLMSLPYRLATTPDTIPAEIPYIFADPDLERHWRERLADVPGFKIGIVWQGNIKCPGDPFRSVPLALYAPLAEVPGVRLITLQKGPGSEQLAAVADTWNVLDFGDAIDTTSGAFMDTAAIMKNLDLVVTSDTAAAHLAGALGVRTWVPLPFIPDWRAGCWTAKIAPGIPRSACIANTASTIGPASSSAWPNNWRSW